MAWLRSVWSVIPTTFAACGPWAATQLGAGVAHRIALHVRCVVDDDRQGVGRDEGGDQTLAVVGIGLRLADLAGGSVSPVTMIRCPGSY